MPNVQLTRLRSQIKALMNHYTDADLFRDSLLSILNMYSQRDNPKKFGLYMDFGIPSMNVPNIVLTELNSIFEQAARDYPDKSLKHSETLGNMEYLETKLLSFSILISLPSSCKEEIFTRLRKMIHDDNTEALNEKFLGCLEENPVIMLSENWLNLIEDWLLSENLQTRKIGMSALTRLIKNKNFDYFPKVFAILTPLFSRPSIEVRQDLMELLKEMIIRTEPETASFLISIAKLHANDENRVFIRRCLPLFNQNLQNEIKGAL